VPGAERKRDLARIAAESEAAATARRAEIAAETARKVAKDRVETAKFDAEAMLAARTAETTAMAAHIAAQNTRSEATLAHEVELARLESMPKIVAEMVKPVEKIGKIDITQVGSVEGSRGAILQALDSVLEQAVHAPNLHRVLDQIGDEIRDGTMDRKDRRRRRDE